MIPYGKHNLNKKDIESVLRVLKTDYLTQGPEVEKFERKISLYCKSKYSVAVNSATSALHISCLALGLGKGDILWTSAISFVASSNCALYCGAEVDFIDIDSKTFNMSVEKLEEKLILAKIKKKLPKIVIPVHLSGLPCELEKIHKLSKKYGFKIIEDASHAIGSIYKNNKIGHGKYSDITVFSFHPVKIITSGEGGVATTNNKEIFQKLFTLRTHGITRNSKLFSEKNPTSLHYEQTGLGFNYRMNDIQAALGSSQMNRIDHFIKRRRSIANYYSHKLANLDINLPYEPHNSSSSYHLYIIRIKNSSLGHKEKIIKKFKNEGVLLSFHYMPIFLHNFYKKMNFNHSDFPESLKYYRDALSIPIYPTLKKLEQNKIISLMEDFFSK